MVFSLECVLKVIAFGFLVRPGACLLRTRLPSLCGKGDGCPDLRVVHTPAHLTRAPVPAQQAAIG